MSVLTQEWFGIVDDNGAEIWERSEGSLLVVWSTKGDLKRCLERAVHTASALRHAGIRSGYRVSAGLAPGVARISPDNSRPAEGWELAGPFYLARWMMNLSAHRGRVLVTEVAAKQVDGKTSLLGRICIQGSRYINLHEVA